ncbi:enoyl-CoA hydratase/isomerase family protein [Sporosarcina sp. 179-K 3D1 HS]|uniref:enoyl-CoA hydratase/isomerase family protein n=1 Tax=Sporosarcina sp. 179-K 3D1 HS TaxID=3232169 RepID=UPI0039A1F19C
MNTNEPAVLMEKEDNIAIVTLNRPDALNAFNVEIRDQLYEYILAINADPTTDAVVVCGAGRGFCAGADLTEFGTETTVIRKRRIRLQHDLWEEIRRMPKPIAVAMHGFSVGSGLEMSMLCDFRFAAPGTKLSLPEARIGMIPAAGGTQSLPRLLRQGQAMEFSLSGRQITAEEGVKLGMISALLPKETLVQDAIQFMKRIVQNNPQVSQWIKVLAAHGMDMPLSEGIAKERILIERSWKERKKRVAAIVSAQASTDA